MRRKPLIPIRLLLLICVFSFLICHLSFSPSAAGERLVLAFYYAWFGMDAWSLPLGDFPLYPYTSTDPAAIERHVREAQQAGIDAFVQSWYGSTVENNQTESNFVQLLEISAGHGFRAAADVEVTGPFIHSAADVANSLRYLLAVHAEHPSYLRVDGKPVVFFWRQGRYSVDTWTSIREQADPGHTSLWIMEGTDLSYLGPFDGNHLYSVAWADDPAGTLVRWGARVRDWSEEHAAPRYWVATVMPGYDDLNTGRADAFVRPRAGGQYYRQCWDGAVRSGADWVIITSYNEWREGTEIETSAGYGDFYLNLTSEMAAAYRQGASPAVLSEAPTEPPPPTETPAPTEALQQAAAPPITDTPVPTPTGTPSPTPSPAPSLIPTSTPVPTSTRIPVHAPPASATATPPPTPTPAASERALDWPGGIWALGGVVALVALGAVAWALRLRRDVIGD